MALVSQSPASIDSSTDASSRGTIALSSIVLWRHSPIASFRPDGISLRSPRDVRPPAPFSAGGAFPGPYRLLTFSVASRHPRFGSIPSESYDVAASINSCSEIHLESQGVVSKSLFKGQRPVHPERLFPFRAACEPFVEIGCPTPRTPRKYGSPNTAATPRTGLAHPFTIRKFPTCRVHGVRKRGLDRSPCLPVSTVRVAASPKREECDRRCVRPKTATDTD